MQNNIEPIDKKNIPIVEIDPIIKNELGIDMILCDMLRMKLSETETGSKVMNSRLKGIASNDTTEKGIIIVVVRGIAKRFAIMLYGE